MNLSNAAKMGLAVLRYKLTGKRIPIAVAWLITGRCNLACHYCKWKDQRQSEELDTSAVKDFESYDAIALGFREAFSRLTIPDCDGCVCVGKLRLSKVYQLDAAIIREMLGLWR